MNDTIIRTLQFLLHREQERLSAELDDYWERQQQAWAETHGWYEGPLRVAGELEQELDGCLAELHAKV